jgi:hypothetical protein
MPRTPLSAKKMRVDLLRNGEGIYSNKSQIEPIAILSPAGHGRRFNSKSAATICSEAWDPMPTVRSPARADKTRWQAFRYDINGRLRFLGEVEASDPVAAAIAACRNFPKEDPALLMVRKALHDEIPDR